VTPSLLGERVRVNVNGRLTTMTTHLLESGTPFSSRSVTLVCRNVVGEPVATPRRL